MPALNHRALIPTLMTGVAIAALLTARPARSEHPTVHDETAFDHPWALAAYATGWHGAYGALGAGARLRLEFGDWIGVQVFAEALAVEWPHGSRRDVPAGFDLYIPIQLTGSIRLLPLAGMCAMFSFIQSEFVEAPDADDILFGVHGGLGAEIAVGRRVSLFVDAKAITYWGHEREVEAWTGAVGETLTQTWHAQVSLGIQVHL